MNLDRLRAVQAEEREADSLRPLPDAFYREVADYLDELREQRAEAAAASDDPFGADDVRRLTDEIENAEEVVEAIYERRVGKLVKRASLAAAGMPADEEGLTSEEAELFRDLVAQIEDHRETVLASFSGGRRSGAVAQDVTSGEGDSAVEDHPETDVSDAEPGATLDATDAMGGIPEDASADSPPPDPEGAAGDVPTPPPDEPPSGEPMAGEAVESDSEDGRDDDKGAAGEGPDESTDGGQAAADEERMTVRITRDVGEVFGVDERTYDLASEDVVTLPTANAKPLLERDAAEKVE